MKIYDLSHPLNNHIPVYPGTAQPSFSPSNTIQSEGFRETHLSFESHVGTHIDAPAHMKEDVKTLDRLPLDAFTGEAVIITVPGNTQFIEKQFLLEFQKDFISVDFVLFNTGWSKYWGKSGYFRGYPTLTKAATDWLLTFHFKGIGFDTISVDPADSKDYPNHLKIFDKNLIIIENLLFPENLTVLSGTFFCFPLPLENADGSPVRAVLIK